MLPEQHILYKSFLLIIWGTSR